MVAVHRRIIRVEPFAFSPIAIRVLPRHYQILMNPLIGYSPTVLATTKLKRLFWALLAVLINRARLQVKLFRPFMRS